MLITLAFAIGLGLTCLEDEQERGADKSKTDDTRHPRHFGLACPADDEEPHREQDCAYHHRRQAKFRRTRPAMSIEVFLEVELTVRDVDGYKG